jgi:ElaB/YqjD/DUF883 family membrane-anchored ribosome-binding protein
MNAINDTAQTYADDARAEIAALRAKVDMLVQNRVNPALHAMAQEAETMAHSAADTMKAQATRLTDGVKDQPVMALGIAAAIGFMLATLVRR